MPWSPALKSAARCGLHVEPAVNEPVQVLRAVLGVAVMLFGTLALGYPQLATSAALGTFIAGTATFQRSFRPRPFLALCAAAGLSLSAFVGYLVSPWPWLFVPVVGVWAFAAGLLWALGQTAGIVASNTLSVMLIIVTLPENVGGAAIHAAVIALGGIVQALLAAVWPWRRWAAQRDALADAYASVADYARRLRHDPFAPFDPGALMTARQAAVLSAGQARKRPADLAGMRSYAERMRPVLAAMADPRVGAAEEGPERDRARELLATAAMILDAIARSIRTGRPEPVPERAYHSLAMPATGPVLHGAGRQSALRLIGLLAEAADAVDSVDQGDPVSGRASAPGHLAWPSPAQLVPLVLHALRRHWNRSSPVLRHAVRLAVVAALGVVIGRSLPVHHGYWVPMTAVMVMRPDFSQTYTRGVARLVGTLFGVALATTVVELTHPGPWVCAGLAVLCIGSGYLTMRSGYVLLSTFVSGYVVFLLAMAGGEITSSVEERVVLTLLGGLLALAAYALFPTWQTVTLPDRVGAYVQAGGVYAAAAVRAFGAPGPESAAAVREALLDHRQARAALLTASEQAAAEPVRHHGLRAGQLADVRSAMAALGRTAMLMEAHLPGRDAAPVPGAVRFADTLAEQTARAAEAIRAEQPVDFCALRERYADWGRELPVTDDTPARDDTAGHTAPARLVQLDAGLLVEALEGLEQALED